MNEAQATGVRRAKRQTIRTIRRYGCIESSVDNNANKRHNVLTQLHIIIYYHYNSLAIFSKLIAILCAVFAHPSGAG